MALFCFPKFSTATVYRVYIYIRILHTHTHIYITRGPTLEIRELYRWRIFGGIFERIEVRDRPVNGANISVDDPATVTIFRRTRPRQSRFTTNRPGRDFVIGMSERACPSAVRWRGAV